MLDSILNLLYPNVCGFCNKICFGSICKKCELKLKKYEINNVGARPWLALNKHFDYLISLFKYEGIIREKIIEYKFGDKAYLHKTFAKIILKNEKVCGFLRNYDIIIPVPLHKKKKHIRGYNQTELIAKELAENIPNLKLETNILIKTKNTEVQSLLTKNQRRENIKNAFDVKDIEKIKGKRIILFDDIYTTGATTDECKRILKKAGAKEILVLTIAKD